MLQASFDHWNFGWNSWNEANYMRFWKRKERSLQWFQVWWCSSIRLEMRAQNVKRLWAKKYEIGNFLAASILFYWKRPNWRRAMKDIMPLVISLLSGCCNSSYIFKLKNFDRKNGRKIRKMDRIFPNSCVFLNLNMVARNH